MRKSFLILSLIFFTSGIAQAQNTSGDSGGPYPEYANIVKIAPSGFSRSYFELVYERYFESRGKSIIIAPTFMLKESGFESFRGAQLMSQFRIYLNNIDKRVGSTWIFQNIGYYAAPIASGLTYSEDFTAYRHDDETRESFEFDATKDVKAGEIGIVMGMQLHATARFVFDIFAGGGIRYADETDNLPQEFQDQQFRPSYGVLDIEYTGIKPMGGFHVGFTF